MRLARLSEISILALAFFVALIDGGGARSQTLPSDANPTCVVAPNAFQSWFDSGLASVDGTIKPANSLAFPNVPNCSFYQWSEQMFLWLTSPTTSRFGGVGRVFDSLAFFDVSPADQSGKRQFLPHLPTGVMRAFSVRTPEVGPHGLPVVFSKSGNLFEVVSPPTGPDGNPLLHDASGNVTAVASMGRDENNRLVFLNRDGKVIEQPATASARPSRDEANQSGHIARRLVVGGKAVLLDSSGNVIQTEEGQASDFGESDVLISSGGSLVYYVTIVNDVFAFMRTGESDGGITPAPSQFPTTQSELDKIAAFAAAHGKTFPDAEALAIITKTAWVEAAGLSNPDDYLTVDAVVPIFDKSDPKKWSATGQKNVKLALVGMHVVGSAAGHPELIWATFEHLNNSPLGAYTYFDTNNVKKSVAQSASDSWLFSSVSSSNNFNVPHAIFDAGAIEAKSPFVISAADTIRWKAWGAAFGVSPNPIDASDTASNTEIISINNSVRGQLAKGDARANYVLVGATWTTLGQPPNARNQVGTSKLANTTMETYQQGTGNAVGGTNCFSCHKTNQTSVSHVYGDLNPLF